MAPKKIKNRRVIGRMNQSFGNNSNLNNGYIGTYTTVVDTDTFGPITHPIWWGTTDGGFINIDTDLDTLITDGCNTEVWDSLEQYNELDEPYIEHDDPPTDNNPGQEIDPQNIELEYNPTWLQGPWDLGPMPPNTDPIPGKDNPKPNVVPVIIYI